MWFERGRKKYCLIVNSWILLLSSQSKYIILSKSYPVSQSRYPVQLEHRICFFSLTTFPTINTFKELENLNYTLEKIVEKYNWGEKF